MAIIAVTVSDRSVQTFAAAFRKCNLLVIVLNLDWHLIQLLP